MALTGHGLFTKPPKGPCLVCGEDCKSFPDVEPHDRYPFLPGGRSMAEPDYVIAPHRIRDKDGTVVYGAGTQVPMADAVKYGLVPKPAKAKKASKRARKGPAEDRARKKGEDR